MLQPVGCVSALPSTLRHPAFSFLLLFGGVPSPPHDSQSSFPFFSPPAPAVCRAGQTQGPTHHIIWQNIEPDINLSQPENMMEGREAPKNCGRNELSVSVQEQHPEASTTSACLSHSDLSLHQPCLSLLLPPALPKPSCCQSPSAHPKRGEPTLSAALTLLLV